MAGSGHAVQTAELAGTGEVTRLRSFVISCVSKRRRIPRRIALGSNGGIS